MGTRLWAVVVVVLVAVMILSVPVARAANPGQQPVPPIPPASDKLSQAYLDAVEYWFKYYYGDQDWQTRMALALTPEPDYDQKGPLPGESKPPKAPQFVIDAPKAEHVTLTGVPAGAWWIDVWRMELDGAWTKIPSFRPAGAAPGPVEGDLAIQGKLPGVYVIRVCDRSGAVLLDAPKVMLVSWTGGSGGRWPQTFDVPTLPEATAAMLSGITM